MRQVADMSLSEREKQSIQLGAWGAGARGGRSGEGAGEAGAAGFFIGIMVEKRFWVMKTDRTYLLLYSS